MGLLVVLVAAECGGAGGDAAASKGADGDHPAWLLGSYQFSSHDGGGNAQTDVIRLEAGGSGERKFLSFHSESGIDLEHDTPLRWAWNGNDLTFDGVPQRNRIAANCRLMQLDDWTFEHRSEQGGDHPIAGCPFVAPPLTPNEERFVGVWQRHGDGPSLVDLGRDRNMFMDVGTGLDGLDRAYTIDEDGTLHGNRPDGTEVYTAHLSLSAGALSWCEGKACLTLRAQ